MKAKSRTGRPTRPCTKRTWTTFWCQQLARTRTKPNQNWASPPSRMTLRSSQRTKALYSLYSIPKSQAATTAAVIQVLLDKAVCCHIPAPPSQGYWGSRTFWNIQLAWERIKAARVERSWTKNTKFLTTMKTVGSKVRLVILSISKCEKGWIITYPDRVKIRGRYISRKFIFSWKWKLAVSKWI